MQSPRGTHDILPSQIAAWHKLEAAFAEISSLYGYQEIRTPIFEQTEVFVRAIGEHTDVVGKEMYTFPDKGGDSMTLRPEMTASVIRAAIQHKLLGENPLQRLWYAGELFRYERPQAGRYRQFHQFGVECIGATTPEADVEVILLAVALLNRIGIHEYKLELNTLASKEVRQKYREELVRFLQANKEKLSPDSQVRLEKNPLRVLDSKNPNDKMVVIDAPTILDFLDEECQQHFDTVKALLTAENIEFTIQPRLVRGLDYYSHTVFEFVSTALGAQSSLLGGGRYNDMFVEFGAKPTGAVGFAMGIERLIMIMEQLQPDLYQAPKPKVMLVTLDRESLQYAQSIAQTLRQAGISTVSDLQRRSLKAQMREADRLGTHIAVIIGENERQNGKAVVKNMQTGEQHECAVGDVAAAVTRWL
ncbi:MAG: histidine--tRNA ligase [Candidatus Kapaibacterium sp.]